MSTLFASKGSFGVWRDACPQSGEYFSASPGLLDMAANRHPDNGCRSLASPPYTSVKGYILRIMGDANQPPVTQAPQASKGTKIVVS